MNAVVSWYGLCPVSPTGLFALGLLLLILYRMHFSGCSHVTHREFREPVCREAPRGR